MVAVALLERQECVTMCHMKSVSIRELHAQTGRWVRRAAEHGEILVTDRGRIIAKLVAQSFASTKPYFSDRKMLPAFRKFANRARKGLDVTQLISEDRDEHAR